MLKSDLPVKEEYLTPEGFKGKGPDAYVRALNNAGKGCWVPTGGSCCPWKPSGGASLIGNSEDTIVLDLSGGYTMTLDLSTPGTGSLSTGPHSSRIEFSGLRGVAGITSFSGRGTLTFETLSWVVTGITSSTGRGTSTLAVLS